MKIMSLKELKWSKNTKASQLYDFPAEERLEVQLTPSQCYLVLNFL